MNTKSNEIRLKERIEAAILDLGGQTPEKLNWARAVHSSFEEAE